MSGGALKDVGGVDLGQLIAGVIGVIPGVALAGSEQARGLGDVADAVVGVA